MTPPASSAKTSERIVPWIGSIPFPLTLYIAGFFVFFRGQLFSDFDLVFGDRGDARFVTFIHEHVYRWLHGGTALLSPPFFFNQTKTLGYSDAFLLDQIIYAPLRLFGAEPMLAVSLTAAVLSSVTFLFLYLFLRRLDVSVFLASLAALIFTFANNLYLKSGHLQHFAVYYIPVIVYCGLLAVSDVHRRPIRAYLLGGFAAGLYGLLFSTGYYMAWFFGLGLLIFTPIAGYIAWPAVRTWWSTRPTRVLGLGLVASLSFLAALSIFAAIYGPVLATGAARGFGDYLTFAPTPIDLVNVGSQNLVWSGLIRGLHLIRDNRLDNGEVSIALTPVVQILVASSAVLAFCQGFWPTNDAGRISRAFVIAGACVCVLFYLLTIKTHNLSLFHVLYALVPGAKAIRVGYRGMVVANLFAVTAIGLTFDRVIRLTLQESHRSLRLSKLGAATAVLALAAIEQVNLSQRTILSRNFEHQHLAAVVNHPRECPTFYVAPQAGRAPFEVQIDAIMVAQKQGLPTINGYSGLNPPGWDFYDTNTPDYERHAVRWALRRGVGENLCRVNVERGTWTFATLAYDLPCGGRGCPISFGQSHEFEIDLGTGGNGALFTDDNWSGAEPWGQWTNATPAALLFSVGRPRNLSVELSIRPLLARSAPKQKTWVEANHCWVGSIEFDSAHVSGSQTISGAIPANCVDADGKIILRINTDRVRTPMEIGISSDSRQLGVGVERVAICESGAVPQAQ
ncbi:MAG: hypothetical protein ACLP0B_12965 [Steroidobacteraceae bacterium]